MINGKNERRKKKKKKKTRANTLIYTRAHSGDVHARARARVPAHTCNRHTRIHACTHTHTRTEGTRNAKRQARNKWHKHTYVQYFYRETHRRSRIELRLHVEKRV